MPPQILYEVSSNIIEIAKSVLKWVAIAVAVSILVGGCYIVYDAFAHPVGILTH